MLKQNISLSSFQKTTAYLKKKKVLNVHTLKLLNVHTYVIILVYFIFRRYVDWYFVYEKKIKVHVFSSRRFYQR